ncbi:cytochrome P450 [Nonomuraea wenchangensis]|uniref:Cytochrome P450 n=1 Tax=Nonomuraea wenchangensis TaxID=568860 RepID=A0A1I0AKB1_9ACTN|nr:cytochrome P450 [Nonomuraea wenchangensis]SES94636.1 Cytochrome P450 [Nonomuraea wenchangensis]
MDDAARSFPFTPADPLEPPQEYAELRRDEPVARVRLPSGDLAWLVSRYESVRQVLADDARFSREAITAPGAPRVLPIAEGSKSIFVMDPPEHTRLRRLVSKAFTARRVEALRPRIQQITDDLLGAMVKSGPPADLMSGLAQPLPITVICELLGVPYADVGRFRQWTDLMLSFDRAMQDQVRQARERLNDYLTALIEAKRSEPADDVLTVLIEARDEGDRLSQEELLAFGYTLLGAGYHATTASIAHAVLTLLREEDELRLLRSGDRPPLAAVDELLRRSQAGGGIGALRIATEDVRLDGVLIRAGEAVLPMINSANRDETVFADADGLRLDRRPNPHLSFGHGIHHCLGAQLGRLELEIALGSLLRDLPGLRLAVPESGLRWNRGTAFSRPAELPLTW